MNAQVDGQGKVVRFFRYVGGGIRYVVRLFDWRAFSLVISTILSLCVTAAIWRFGPVTIKDPATLEGALFASWAGGLALFVVGGGFFAGIASLSRPESEHFDNRARILFKKQRGGHIDYIVGQLRGTLEPYSESVVKTFLVTDYHEEEKKFRVEQVTNTVVRAYVDDVDTSFPAEVGYAKACPPPAGGKRACLTFVSVDGEPKVEFEEFDDRIRKEFSGTIPRNKTAEVETKLEYWMLGVEELNSYKPIRYTQSVKLIVANHLKKNMEIRIKASANMKAKELVLKSGQKGEIVNPIGVKPREEAYQFTISPA